MIDTTSNLAASVDGAKRRAASEQPVASMNIEEQYRLLHKPLLLAKQKLSPPRTRRVEWEP